MRSFQGISAKKCRILNPELLENRKNGKYPVPQRGYGTLQWFSISRTWGGGWHRPSGARPLKLALVTTFLNPDPMRESTDPEIFEADPISKSADPGCGELISKCWQINHLIRLKMPWYGGKNCRSGEEKKGTASDVYFVKVRCSYSRAEWQIVVFWR